MMAPTLPEESAAPCCKPRVFISSCYNLKFRGICDRLNLRRIRLEYPIFIGLVLRSGRTHVIRCRPAARGRQLAAQNAPAP